MRPVRFVHAADLHLEAPFTGVQATEPGVKTSLVNSTFEALERIVALCIDRSADFLLISGDVYDNARNFNAQMQFKRQAQALADAGIPVFIAEGNHDPGSARPRDIGLPENVRYFSTRAVERIPFEVDGECVCALYGQGYARAAETRNLAVDFKKAPEDALAIGVLHTNVGGAEGYENYAPCSMDDLRASGMDYWALGHIHKPEVLSTSPAIVYAGCPQGRSPKEDGIRGCYLVELGAAGATLEFVPTCSVVWCRESIDAASLETLDDVRGSVRRACDGVRAANPGLPAVVRFELCGRTEAHASLVRGTNLADLLRDAREEELSGSPWIWIDRIADHTRASIDVDRLRASQDFAGDLVRLTDELSSDDDTVKALIDEIVGPLEASLGAFDLEMTTGELLERARDIALDRIDGDA